MKNLPFLKILTSSHVQIFFIYISVTQTEFKKKISKNKGAKAKKRDFTMTTKLDN